MVSIRWHFVPNPVFFSKPQFAAKCKTSSVFHTRYDANGNRLTANGSAYTTGLDNRLLLDGAYTYTYAYDAEGNRTARFIDADSSGTLSTGDTDVTEYTWDARNRLVKVTDRAIAGGQALQVVDYLYDTENRWIGETIDSDGDGQIDRTIGFVYDGDQIVLQFEKDSSGQLFGEDLTHRYLWQANAVDQLFADEQLSPLSSEERHDRSTLGDVIWTLGDHLGTIRDLAVYDSETGVTTAANHRVYDSFGSLKSQANAAVDCLFDFTGRAYDKATGLQNNLNRWYDAKVGNWTSEDPKRFTAGDTNTSRYCFNSPIDSIDPTGLNRWVLHNGIGWLGHWWIIVEVWDPLGQHVVGYQKLEWDPVQGYTVPEPTMAEHFSALVAGIKPDESKKWEKPGSGGLGDGTIVGEWKSNAAQDKALLDAWTSWDKAAASSGSFTKWAKGMGRTFTYVIGWNCMSAALWWCDYGGDAGPATLLP